MTTYQMIEAIEEANRTWQPLSLPVRNKIAKRLDELECELREAKARLQWFMENQNQIAMDVIRPVEEENARLQHELDVADNWVNHHNAHVNDLIAENARLRDWIREQGQHTDTCTYDILGKEVCRGCQCGRI
jgi:capsule polysaccharide export protein KpsE/RkpR